MSFSKMYKHVQDLNMTLKVYPPSFCSNQSTVQIFNMYCLEIRRRMKLRKVAMSDLEKFLRVRKCSW